MDELAGGVEGDAGLLEKRGRLVIAITDKCRIGPRRSDAGAKFLVGIIHQIHLPQILGDGGGVLSAVAPACGAADAHDAFAHGVLQATERAQPPEDFRVFIDHHILRRPAGLAIFIDGFAQEAWRDDLIPQVGRTRVVAKEHQVGLARNC